jgi:transcriptional regulator with XRE-family HTH domain
MLATMETLGARLGRLRVAHGLTQQELAERIAVSRVAISHFEMDLALPSERTVALLAGVFKQEPAVLVSGTYYPSGKTERLPAVVARYTEVEKELCLLDQDLGWLARLQNERLSFDICHGWLSRIDALTVANGDRRERKLLEEARSRVQAALRACITQF